MLTKEQIRAMLEMQTGMNARVNPNWLNAGYPYLRAAVIEGAEAMEHAGWKWWKVQQRDLAQLQMEQVDIWHFALSAELIRHKGDIAWTADIMATEHGVGMETLDFDGHVYVIKELDLIRKLELLIGLAVSRRFSVALFESLLTDCEMSWDELYRQYVGKNVLNFFRQDFGYKSGEYLKIWDGREDNQHLVEVLAAEDAAAPDFRDRVYAGLEKRYRTVALEAS